MYGSSSPFSPRNQRPSNLYSRIGLETEVHDASPHRLIVMLFDGLFDSLAKAEGALAHGQREIKALALSKAVRILDEGLKAGLDVEQGGALAVQLRELYGYASLRLTQANLRDDVAALQEVRTLLTPVREAWSQITPSTAAAA
jgi:flagellar secretion chaperone FliS